MILAIVAVPPAMSAAEEEEEEDVPMLAVGALSAANAKSSFLLIGVTADAFVHDAYKPEQITNIMAAVVTQLEAVNKVLTKLKDDDLEEDDEMYVAKVIKVHKLLQEEARALTKFADKKGESEAKAFDKARKAAMKAIDELIAKPDEEKKDE